MSIAEQLEDQERYEEAYEEYKKEYAKRPDNLTLLEKLGHLAMLLDKKSEAAEYYSKILDKDMTNTLCYEQLMDIYADTDRYKYYVYRGNLHSVERKLEHAINDFKKAYELNKDFEITNYLIAVDYDTLGKYKDAYGYYKKYATSSAQDDEYKQYAKSRAEELKEYAK